MAWTSRKSSFSASGTFPAVHVAPPSVVSRYVPPVPLAHATRSLTADRPRSDAVECDTCGVHDCAHAAAAKNRTALLLRIKFRRILFRDHGGRDDVLALGPERRVVQYAIADLHRLIDAERINESRRQN